MRNILLLVLSMACAARAETTSRLQRLDVLRGNVETMVATFEKHPGQPGSRDLTHCAHYILALGEDPAPAEAFLRRCFDTQVMNEHAKDFGTVQWIPGRDDIVDANAIEFTLHGVGPIVTRYREKLSPRMMEYLTPHLRAGIAAMRRHHVPVTYTNIFLMKATNLLLCGQAISDTSAMDEGERMLDEWLARTKQYGISEYDSPVYSEIDLNCLRAGHANTNRDSAREKLTKALNSIWTDLAANYFAGQQSLSGPNSRNYSFTDSVNILCNSYYIEGLRDTPGPMGLINEGCDTWASAMEDRAYQPGESILALAKIPERIVITPVGEGPGQDRYNYITPDFAIGSASAYYGTQDKLVDCQLAAPIALPDIAIIADEFDAPYGRVKRPDRSGHNKPLLIKRAMTTVQHKGLLLAMLNLAPGVKGNEMDSVATNVLIPAKAESIFVDGKRIDLSKPFEQPLTPDNVVLVKQGKAEVAIRFVHADGIGMPVRYWLKWDGNDAGAARIVAYHYAGDKKILQIDAVRAAVLMSARECRNETEANTLYRSMAQAQITDRSGKEWHLDIIVGADHLEANQDLQTGKTGIRRVNENEVEVKEFTLNGKRQESW